MFLLNFIPDSIIAAFIHGMVIFGAVALVGGFLLNRLLGPWALMARVIGVLALVGGVYFEGGLQNELYWREQVAKQQEEIAKLEAASQQVSERVVTQYIERVKVVKGKTDVITKEIPKYITKEVDAQCSIPNVAIVLHDAASQNELPDTAGRTNEGTSDITLSKLLDTTVLNYGTFYEVREQLKALQDWVREQKKINP